MIARQRFLEQTQYLEQKIPLPVDTLKGIRSEYHDWAFSASTVTKADFIKFLYDQLTQTINQGGDYQVFVETLASKKKGVEILESFRAKHLYTVFDTNARRSHAAGRLEQLSKPHVRQVFPYLMWLWRDSPKPRPNHQAIDRKIFPADSPFFEHAFPPCGYGCRCGVRAVSEEMLRQNGWKVIKPPDWRTIAEKPFTRSPGRSPKDQRNAFLEEGIKRQSPAMQEVMREIIASQKS